MGCQPQVTSENETQNASPGNKTLSVLLEIKALCPLSLVGGQQAC
jgi:hypothetical protein